MTEGLDAGSRPITLDEIKAVGKALRAKRQVPFEGSYWFEVNVDSLIKAYGHAVEGGISVFEVMAHSTPINGGCIQSVGVDLARANRIKRPIAGLMGLVIWLLTSPRQPNQGAQNRSLGAGGGIDEFCSRLWSHHQADARGS